MLIVSQDGDNLINYNAVTTLWRDKKQIKCIYAVPADEGCIECLGTYATEERAKEILKEIIHKYRHYVFDKNNSVTMPPKVYEMPKK